MNKGLLIIDFRMPKDSETKEKWLKQLKKKHVPGIVVCSKHFEATDFIESSNQGKPALKDDAVPKKVIQVHWSIEETWKR